VAVAPVKYQQSANASDITKTRQIPLLATVPTASASTSAPLVKLERTIHARAKKPNPKSYTSQLLEGGVPKIGAKIVEEAAELVEAAGEPGQAGQEHFIREAGDLFYHLLVMLCHKNCNLFDVEAELARRFGVSGLEEKASRKKPAATSVAAKDTNSKDTNSKPAAKAVAKPVKKAVKKKVAPAPLTTPAVKKKARRKTRL
jgi:phosphoribosyl-ATP pyrophosphohydrolase